ncbi:ATP-binding protein [Phormidesmis priestleyi ANT.L61.2]
MNEIRQTYRGVVIAVGGPPHSGKSVFLSALYRQLLARQPAGIFLQRVCPDGEGMWSNESDPQIVKTIRRKGAFSEEFVTISLRNIEQLGQNTQFPLVLLDLGGKRSAENAEILRRSQHSIILSADPQEAEWQQFALDEGCTTLAVFHSQLIHSSDGMLDTTVRSEIDFTTTPISGTLCNLDRQGNSVCYQDAIHDLTVWLIKQFLQRKEITQRISHS